MITPSDDGPQASSLQTESQTSSLPIATHKGWYSRGYLPHFDQPGLLQGVTFRLWDSLPSHVVESLAQELKQTAQGCPRSRELERGHPGRREAGKDARVPRELERGYPGRREAGKDARVPRELERGYPGRREAGKDARVPRESERDHPGRHITDAAKRARIESYLNTGHGACYLRDPRIGRLVENALLYFDRVRYRMIAWVVMPNHVHTLIETVEGYPLHTILHSWKSYTANKANQILGRRGKFWFPEYFDRYIRDERHFANAVRYIHENPVKAGLVEKPEDWPFSSARLLERA